MPHVIVESLFDQMFTEEDHEMRGAQLHPCLAQNGVRWIHSFVSKDRRRMICHFEAADAESVRMAHRTANVRFSRVWPAEMVTQDDV